MKSFNAHGVLTQWPFEPYEQQREYCKRVIEAIKKRQNAILESPTGTGKTMSLLVSSLAWQQCTSDAKMIYYLSRTHIQLSQAAKEMKKTAYSKVPSVVLASRTHLCLNNEVKNQSHGHEAALNRSCRNAISRNACDYYTDYQDKLKAQLNVNKVHDIEDLYSFGRQHQCCPYYASKKIAESQAALVFMPYNYVLDLSVRKSTQLKLEHSVLIVDEGHNFESSLKEAASAQITLNSLKKVQESIEKVPHKLSEALMRDKGLTRRKTSILDDDPGKESKKKKKTDSDKMSMMEEISMKLTTDKLQQANKCARLLMNCQELLKTKDGCYIDTRCDIYSLKTKLEEAGISYSTADAIVDTLETVSSFWSIVGVVNPNTIAQYNAATSSLSHFIGLFFPLGTMTLPKFEQNLINLKNNYSAYMSVEQAAETVLQKSSGLVNWTVNLWCLNPGSGMKRVLDESCVEGPRSIIITSGTLAPIRRMETDLEKKFTITEEFGHLIRKDQISIKIISKSPRDVKLDTSFQGTSNLRCLVAIGETLATLLSTLPYGTLVFFPSYRLMNMVVKHSGDKPFWKLLDKSTKLFVECSNQSTFSNNLTKYKNVVDAGGRAAFIGVCRGKLSEGTNLERHHCRSVIIVGLPYPNRGDAQLQETLQFHSNRGDVGGNLWYSAQMRRSLCQAIGRVIRNKEDFGMVLLLGSRFDVCKLTVSKWIQEYYPEAAITDYKQLTTDIKEFFTSHNIDISLMTPARAVCPTETGAFEFAAPVRRKEVQPKKLLVNSKANIETPEVTPAARTFAQRQAEMMADYAAKREQYKQSQKEPPKKPPEVEAAKPKKFKTNSDLFHSIYTSESPCLDSPGTQDEPITIDEEPPSQNYDDDSSLGSVPPTQGLQNDKPKPQDGKQKCYICKNDPVQPYLTNCECSRLGCYSCLKSLNKKSCGECGVKFKLKQFKPKLFNMFKKK